VPRASDTTSGKVFGGNTSLSEGAGGTSEASTQTIKEVAGLIWEETTSEQLGKVMTKALCCLLLTFMGRFSELSVGSRGRTEIC